jgi:hypothetical protein
LSFLNQEKWYARKPMVDGGRDVQETGSCAEMKKAYKDTGMWEGVRPRITYE